MLIQLHGSSEKLLCWAWGYEFHLHTYTRDRQRERGGGHPQRTLYTYTDVLAMTSLLSFQSKKPIIFEKQGSGQRREILLGSFLKHESNFKCQKRLGTSEKPKLQTVTGLVAPWQTLRWKVNKLGTVKRASFGKTHDEVFIKYSFYRSRDRKRCSVSVMFYKNKGAHIQSLSAGKQNKA